MAHAARLLARSPLVTEYLADGRSNAGAVLALEDVLQEDRLVEILARSAQVLLTTQAFRPGTARVKS